MVYTQKNPWTRIIGMIIAAPATLMYSGTLELPIKFLPEQSPRRRNGVRKRLTRGVAIVIGSPPSVTETKRDSADEATGPRLTPYSPKRNKKVCTSSKQMYTSIP